MYPVLLQRSVCAALEAHPYFTAAPAIPCIPRSQGDVLTAVEEARSRIGVCVVVGPAGGRFIRPETPFVQIDGRHSVTVIENVAVNRGPGGTGQPAETISWAAAQILHHTVPLHPDDGTQLSGGGWIIDQIEEAQVEDRQGGLCFISELTIRSLGGALPGASSRTLTRS